jgi:hypothetical protein
VERNNSVRLNSATGYITPKGVLAGRQQRSMQTATASWMPPDSNARVTASKPRE